jgi:hypothetical protein
MRSGGKEEWAKDDCVPRKGKAVDPQPQHGSGLARSGSILARTARAALGLGGAGAGDKKNDLAVFVSREVRVSETGVRGAKPKLQPRHSISNSPGSGMSLAAMLRDGPGSPDLNRGEEDMSEDETARRTRRLQLAKVCLYRTIGY